MNITIISIIITIIIIIIIIITGGGRRGRRYPHAGRRNFVARGRRHPGDRGGLY